MLNDHPILLAYSKTILAAPKLVILCVLCVVAFFGAYVPQFRIDASSDSLVLQSDKALEFYRQVRERYGSDDYLIVTFEPKSRPLFEPEVLDTLKDLHADLANLDQINSVTSIMNVPLLREAASMRDKTQSNFPMLEDGDIDLKAAKAELKQNPLYKNVLISSEGNMAAILVMPEQDKKLLKLTRERSDLRQKKNAGTLTLEEKDRIRTLELETQEQQSSFQQKQKEMIENVRDILTGYEAKARLHLGGVSMIIADSVSFIQQDLKTFGWGVLGLIVLLLGVIFRQPRWIILPILTCGAVSLTVIGFLGFLNWPVTIVSANFVALIMIFTLSFCVHQIVRYREIREKQPDLDSCALAVDMVRAIGLPCFYMGVTTAVAFGSLVVSDIKPVIDFGWMVVMGIGVAFVIAFTFFPAAVSLMPPAKTVETEDMTSKIATRCAYLVENNWRSILIGFGLLMVVCGLGTTQLNVQNRFLDYFEHDTEIYQGMLTIDQRLGGTTPMDVVLDAPPDFIEFQKQEEEDIVAMGYGDSMQGPDILQGYWFSDLIFSEVKDIHTYLESLPSTGKVLSIYSTTRVLRTLTEGDLDRFELGVIYQKLPEDIRKILFDPYISNDGNQIRFSIRVYESRKDLNREVLINQIRTYLTEKKEYSAEQVGLTGLVVLYNNVLQSLFGSQIKTLWVVFIALFFVFLVLFRNLLMALVALVPNVAVVLLVLGIMGGAGIPLDIMTITIAAISFGMANDNTIHFIHRFTNEFNAKKSSGYDGAILRSHKTIGRAMFFTSLTITLGFSILAFSNFVPTVYFGLLTGLSMIVALLADLVLLPVIIRLVKPLGGAGKC